MDLMAVTATNTVTGPIKILTLTIQAITRIMAEVMAEVMVVTEVTDTESDLIVTSLHANTIGLFMMAMAMDFDYLF
jgi:hypothetical protein